MIKKLTYTFLVLLSLFALSLGLCACGGGDTPDTPEATTYKVSYYSTETNVVWETTAEKGTLLKDIKYEGPTPEKAPNGSTHYVFAGWDIEDGKTLTADTAIYAKYTEVSDYYEVIYKNYNGVELDRETVLHGGSSVYMGQTPKKPSDTKIYTFKGWSESTENITKNTVFIAQYDEAPLKVLTLSASTKADGTDEYTCFKTTDGQSFYFDIKSSDKTDSRSEYFKLGQKKSLNATAIASIKNISFVDLDGSVTVEYGWRLGGGEIYYCKTATATKANPTVELEFDPTYITFYSASGTAYANKIEIRYSGNENSYNPLTYSSGITFTELGDGTYEAKYGDVIAGSSIFSPDEKIIPDESLLEVVFPMYYLGKPVSTVSAIVGNYKKAYIPEGVTTINFGGIYSTALEDIRIPSTLELVLYTYVKTTNLSYYQTRHPNLSVTSQRGAEYIGNEDSPCIILLRASGNSDGMSRLAKTTRVISTGAFMSKSIYTKDGVLLIPRDVVAIGDNAFSSLHLDIEFEPGSKLTHLGASAFSGARLGDFTLPKGIKEISHSAFSATYITSFTIPRDSALTKIDELAFMSSSIREIYIPSKVNSIGYGAFSGCYNLTTITLEDNHPAYAVIDGHLYTKDGSVLVSYLNAKNETVYNAPASLVRVPQNAFIDCTNLKAIYLSANTAKIDAEALYSLTAAIYCELDYIPSGWNYLDYSGDVTFTVWTGASQSTVITVDGFDFLIKNGEATLTKNLGVDRSSVSIPQYVTKDGTTYPVTSIGRCAFYDNVFKDGATLSLPKSVSSIGDYAFFGCNFKSIALPEMVESIGVSAFAHVGLKEYYIPSTVVSVGEFAFSSYTPCALYYDGSVENFFNTISFFDCVSSDVTLYFNINGQFVQAGLITNLPTFSQKVLDSNVVRVFSARNSCFSIRISKNVETIINSFDGWLLDLEGKESNLVIYYEGSESEFEELLDKNGLISLLGRVSLTVFYNQKV